ncbi:MAG TPA: NAD(P)H-dependent glycerol-3-phosphate dehydrogenase [Bryobacteraceae bacterium]|jgi:glycerol-3-phosphate dehydrogenase (NAD(P)+)
MRGKVNLAIIGGGSWGTALSLLLAPQFQTVRLWMHEADIARQMKATRETSLFLPGFRLPENVSPSSQIAESLEGAHIVIGVMPSQHARTIYGTMLSHLNPDSIIVSATKGLETGSLLRMSQVIEQVCRPRFKARVAVLSGPTFAREIAQGEPAAVVAASQDLPLAREVQSAFSTPAFRLYTNSDPVGVEIAASLKNVVAIAAGVCYGLGLGSNVQAALITRGLAEITRLTVAMGGKPQTLAGLAGLGDLVLTCSGNLSRNRQVGLELAKGRRLSDILGSMRMVAEGVETCGAAVELGQKFEVDLPIIQQMHAVLHASKSPREALRDLMERSLKEE